jgi:hypothetical protein
MIGGMSGKVGTCLSPLWVAHDDAVLGQGHGLKTCKKIPARPRSGAAASEPTTYHLSSFSLFAHFCNQILLPTPPHTLFFGNTFISVHKTSNTQPSKWASLLVRA